MIFLPWITRLIYNFEVNIKSAEYRGFVGADGGKPLAYRSPEDFGRPRL
jgi:hypothetical protein